MSIFAPALRQSLRPQTTRAAVAPAFPSPLGPRARQVSVDPADAAAAMEDGDSQAMDDSRRVHVAAGPLSPSSTSSTAPSLAATQTPRTEYDEGMNSYARPVRIDSKDATGGDCCCDYQHTVPVLLFNIGQLHILGGDDARAANYFMYALDIINQRNDAAAAGRCPLVSPMPILHNLGHIYYRAQNYKLALSMYSKALDIAQRRPKQQQSEDHLLATASTLNCLGVIFFHMSGNSDENASKALDMFTTRFQMRLKVKGEQ